MNGGALASRLERVTAPASFGAGNREPYDNALRRGRGTLRLHEHDADRINPEHIEAEHIDIRRFLAPADQGDREVIAHVVGPVLDVGCGPGRIVKAAIDAGHLTLGIDVSRVAIAIARGQGLPAMRRSVFEPIPAEGRWGTIVLFDGNIGIGGDPQALLERCSQLASSDGRVLVETHRDPARDRTISGIIVDDFGHESLPFPWAEAGHIALRSHAAKAGLAVAREWMCRGRAFAEYVRL